MAEHDSTRRTTTREDPAAQAAADRAALERLYGSPSSSANGQWGLGIALIVFGAGLMAWGAAADGEPGLLAVGALAIAVGIWSVFDGLARRRKARQSEPRR